MDTMETAVLAGGVALVAFVLWFFFGARKRTAAQVGDGGSDGTGEIGIVGVQVGEDLTLGEGKTFGDGIGGTSVRLRNETNEFRVERGVTREDFEGSIGGPAIEYDVFEIRIVLPHDTLDGFHEKFLRVETRSHYRYGEGFRSHLELAGRRLGRLAL